MADNIVTIQVRIDDKGNLSAVGNKAEAAAGKMDKASKSAGTLGRNMKGAGEASSGAGKNFSKMSQGMGGFVGAYATLAANVFAVSAAFNFLKRAADVEQLRKSQVEFANSTGTALQSMTSRLREASGGMLGFQEAASAAAIGSAKGFSAQQLEELAIGAGKVSKALGRDFTDSFDRLVRGISKAEPELLDELGITLRLEEATNRYAKALGVNAKELTTYQRSQAVLAETQRQLNDQFGDFEGSENAFVKLQKTFEDVVNLVMEKVLPVFKGFANVISNNIGLAIGIFAVIGAKIFSTIPAVSGLSESLDDFVQSAEEGIQQQTEKMDEYAESIANAKKELQEQADMADNTFKGAQKGAKKVAEDLDARKGSGLEALQQGKDPSKKQLAGMLRAAKNNQGEYKKLDKERRLYFIAQLEKMQKANKKTNKSILVGAKKVGLGMKSIGFSIQKFIIGTYNKAGLTAKKTYALMGKGAIKTGKVVQGGMKLGVIGAVIFGILEGLENIQKFPITFLKGMINMVVRIGTAFQGLINAILFGLNEIANKIGGFFGREETEAYKLELLDEDSSKEIFEYINSIEALEETMTALNKIEADNQAAKERKESIEAIGEAAATVAEDLKAINEGLKGMAGPEASMNRLTGVATAGISSIVNKALADATTGEGVDKVIDPAIAKEGMDEIIKTLGDQAEALSPRLREMLNLPIEEAFAAISNYETQAQAFTSMSKQFGSEIEAVQEQLGSGNFEAALKLIEPLEKTRNTLTELAEKTKEQTDAKETLDKAFEFAGGIDGYRTQIEALIEREDALKQKRHELNLQAADTQLLNSAFQGQAQERMAILEAEFAVTENQLDLDKKRLLLKEKLGGLGEGAEKTQAIIDLENEIEAQERLGIQLLKNVDIAESKADDIAKLGLTIGNSLQENLSGAFNALVQGTKSFKEAFADMAKAILADIAKMITKMLIMRMLTAAFGGSGFGDFLGIPAPGAKKGGVLEPPQYRYGGIAKMEDYSRGGIAKGRQAGYPAVLHGTEAVVPLPDNRSIPVEMKGAGMGTQNNVTVNVSIDNEGRTQQNTQSDGAMGENLGKLIASAVQDELHFQKRSGGILNPYGAA